MKSGSIAGAALLLAAAVLAPPVRGGDREAAVAEWLATVGDWYSDDETGILQLRAGRLALDTLRLELSLAWLVLDPDGRTYRTARSVGPLALCGATAFADVRLALAADASPAETDLALEIRGLDGADGAPGRTAAVFLVVDKQAGDYRVLNCR